MWYVWFCVSCSCVKPGWISVLSITQGLWGGGGLVCRYYLLSTDHRKMDALESHNYDKFTLSILQVPPSLFFFSLSLTHYDRHACNFTHNTPFPSEKPHIPPLLVPPFFQWQSVHMWLMYAVKLLATTPLTSPPPPESAHPSPRPFQRPHSNKFVTICSWNIDISREGDEEWNFG